MTSRLIRRAAAPLLALGALVGAAQAAAPADPSGTWLTEDGRARIRVEKCGPQDRNVCGFVVWLKEPLNDQGQPRTDFKNPDPKKQSRASLGHQLIMGLKPNADGRYEGKIYNSEGGKFYDVTIWTDQPGELNIRGCMLAVLCGSQVWKQVTNVASGQLVGPTGAANGPHADAEWARPVRAATAAPAAGGSSAIAKTAKKPAQDGAVAAAGTGE